MKEFNRKDVETKDVSVNSIDEAYRVYEVCTGYKYEDREDRSGFDLNLLDSFETEPKPTNAIKNAEKEQLDFKVFDTVQCSIPEHLCSTTDAVEKMVRYFWDNKYTDCLKATSEYFRKLSLFTAAYADRSEHSKKVRNQVSSNHDAAILYIQKWEAEQQEKAASGASFLDAIRELVKGNKKAEEALENALEAEDARKHVYGNSGNSTFKTPKGQSFEGLTQLA
ncbi:hypothetical protein [Endozoicomonas arenosclerae]|uniref:hypothetical protein n=1 Tax=Endozoicomonas arenosclerae TaxID=1633495 RepID=UPI000782DF01|nr:hypothetical protein [Endozoicomonas arenosclerae]